MGLTSTSNEVLESKWQILTGSTLEPTQTLLKQVKRVTLLDTEYGLRIKISLNSSVKGEEEVIWVPADLNLEDLGHNVKLDKNTLKFFLLTNTEDENEHGLGQQTQDFLENYPKRFQTAVKKLAKDHPVKLFATAEAL